METGNYLTVGSASDFAFGTDNFTIETWVNFQDTSTSGLNRRIFKWDASGNASDNLQIIVDEGGATLDGSVFVFSNSILLNANTVINEGAWHHIAVARSGSTIKLFVDGTEKASTVSFGIPSLIHQILVVRVLLLEHKMIQDIIMVSSLTSV